MHKSKHRREIPKGIIVDDSFANFLSIAEPNIKTTKYKILYIFDALFKLIFWRELFGKIIKKPHLIKELLLSLRRYKIYDEFLREYIARDDIDVFYTYWNTEVTYVLGDLDRKLNYKIITRVHGYDLYLERTLKSYMPLREQFVDNIDRVFVLSYSARKYIIETYGYQKKLTSISRLGVSDRGIISYPSSPKTLNILSCSSLLLVKRVDKIIDILSLLSNTREDISIYWRHIGGGQLSKEIKEYAKEKLTNHNIKYSFVGELSNREVYQVYQEHNIDLFINMSSSEGVPVSIMEAMSCSVPIIAPNVGGISDMVIDRFNGVLLDSNPEISDVVEALEDISKFKDIDMRHNSYRQYKKLYNSDINYQEFIQEIEKIAE